jgi:hypothetical protein
MSFIKAKTQEELRESIRIGYRVTDKEGTKFEGVVVGVAGSGRNKDITVKVNDKDTDTFKIGSYGYF